MEIYDRNNFFDARIEDISEFGLMTILFGGIIDQERIPFLNATNIEIILQIMNEFDKEGEYNMKL